MEPPRRPAQDPTTQPTTVRIDQDNTKNIPTGGAAAPSVDDDDKPATKPKKRARKGEDEDADGARDAEDDGYAEGLRPAPASPTRLAFADSTGETIEIASMGRRKRWRLAAGLGGGFVRSGGEAVSLLTGGARLEFGIGRRTLAGVDSAVSSAASGHASPAAAARLRLS